MGAKFKKIGVLTSGGDAPGMNAAVRAVTLRGLASGVEVVGINSGYRGAGEKLFTPLTRDVVWTINRLGGTIIGSSRFPSFKDAAVRKQCVQHLKEEGIEGIVVCGGDGSLTGADALHKELEYPTVGLPGTIDNDMGGTDYTIGFDTAMNTALDAIDRVKDTAMAMRRIFFIEVMGRHAGYLALESAVAGGADAVLVPEEDDDWDLMTERLKTCMATPNMTAVVIVAEGDEHGGAIKAAEEIKNRMGAKTYAQVIGYIQRGGRPTARDRVLASKLGAAAAEALIEGKHIGHMAGEVHGKVVFTPYPQTYKANKPLDPELLKLLGLGVHPDVHGGEIA